MLFVIKATGRGNGRQTELLCQRLHKNFKEWFNLGITWEANIKIVNFLDFHHEFRGWVTKELSLTGLKSTASRLIKGSSCSMTRTGMNTSMRSSKPMFISKADKKGSPMSANANERNCQISQRSVQKTECQTANDVEKQCQQVFEDKCHNVPEQSCVNLPRTV